MPGFTLRMMVTLACLALPFFFAVSGAAQALDPEQARARAMLENLCGRCHAVGRVGKSPNPHQGSGFLAFLGPWAASYGSQRPVSKSYSLQVRVARR